MAKELDPTDMEKLAKFFLECPNGFLSEKNILSYILALINTKPSGLVTEKHDNINIEYVGSTNNIDYTEYFLGTTLVATLTFTYVGGAVSDNDLIKTVVKS